MSAQGENVVIFNGGQEGTVDGTSCSTPIFASTVALLNAERLAAGKSVLGFMNPLIYAFPGLFTDVTTGSNPGCNTNGFPVRVCVIVWCVETLTPSLPGQGWMGSGKCKTIYCCCVAHIGVVGDRIRVTQVCVSAKGCRPVLIVVSRHVVIVGLNEFDEAWLDRKCDHTTAVASRLPVVS